jgi:hypothetical protein
MACVCWFWASASPFLALSASPTPRAVPVHMLLGNMPNLVAQVHAEEYQLLSHLPGKSRTLW